MIFVKYAVIFILGVSIMFFWLGLRSQKGQAPGLKDGQLAPLSSKPNAVSSEEGTETGRQVAPLNATLAQAKKAIIATGGTVTTETDTYIAATYMSKIYKFVDDVELRDGGNGVVHIRSGSRVGYSDRGVNRKRVEAIRSAL